MTSDHRLIGPSKNDSAPNRWIDGPTNRFWSRLRPTYRFICILSAQKADGLSSIFAKKVHIRQKTR